MIDRSFGDELASLLIESEVAIPEKIKGFSDVEIEELEHALGYSLPASYRSFLAVMGRMAGNAMPSEKIFFPDVNDILRFQRGFWKVMNKWNPPIANRDTVFSFLSHQGYIYYFFDASQGDRALVYSYMETDEHTKEQAILPEYLRIAIRRAAARRW